MSAGAESIGPNLVPLWSVVQNVVRSEPAAISAPVLWKYRSQVRPAILAAGASISEKEAERRVLLLVNPGLPHLGTTGTLVAGIQLINSGEVADAHRHTQAALRLVLEGNGTFTSVNGERIAMSRGDLILTPSWSWHDHENLSTGPMVWLDGLDVPLINKLGLTFSEQFDGDRYPQSKPDGYSQAVYGHGFVPLGKQFTNDLPRHHAPQLAYPYGEAIQALRLMMEAGAPDSVCGYKLRYTNSATGGHILPTIGAFLQLLPSDFSTKRRRSTDATVFCVLSGRGQTQIDDSIIDWEPNDVFVVPNWTWHSHIAVDEAILFSFSDCALQQSLNLWREEFEASAATS